METAGLIEYMPEKSVQDSLLSSPQTKNYETSTLIIIY